MCEHKLLLLLAIASVRSAYYGTRIHYRRENCCGIRKRTKVVSFIAIPSYMQTDIAFTNVNSGIDMVTHSHTRARIC